MYIGGALARLTGTTLPSRPAPWRGEPAGAGAPVCRAFSAGGRDQPGGIHTHSKKKYAKNANFVIHVQNMQNMRPHFADELDI